MTENIDLLKRREELKLALREENTKTLVDVILEGVTRPFQKVIGSNRIITYVYGTLIVFLLTMLVGMILITLLGESASLQQFVQRYGLWFIMIGLFSSTGSMTLANVFIHRIITIIRESVLDTVETIDTMVDIEQWVTFVCNKKLALAAGVLGIPVGYYLVRNLSAITGSPYGVGLTMLVILFSMQSSIFFGFSITILFLTVRLRNYQLILFSSDPSSSQVISNLSGFMSNFVYLFAIYGALTTFGIITTGLLKSFTLTLPLFWILIVLIFAINQYSLAQIIQRAKWKTLSAVQAQIEKFQKAQAVPDKETRETLIWLLDYHNRVKATRNSALNLEASLNLFNSLLLPVFAFVLGNLDKVIAFFR
jgi:hypothetical protein